MHRKLITIILVLTLAANPVYCYAGVWKLLTGIGLVAGGTFMAIDGFKQIETSKPGVEISDWYWTKEMNSSWQPWLVHAEGKIRNTGNVPLDNLGIWVFFYDASGEEWECGFLHADLAIYEGVPLPPGIRDSWSGDGHAGYWSRPAESEPLTAKVHVQYTYQKQYESKSNLEGIIGIGAIGTGTYLIIDYLIDYSRLKREAGIEIKVANRKDTTYLLCSKTF